MAYHRKLRDDAVAIWRAGVSAVDSTRLVREHVHVDGSSLYLAEQEIDLSGVSRIVVVGAGKAGFGMAAGLEAALGEQIMERTQLTGWVNVPADCVRPLHRIKLHAARPAGVNEPTREGAEGSRRILDLVRNLTDQDLCICLLSGGGSALMPSPVEPVSLEDKLAVTKHLSGAGANIQQLNTVRKQLSAIKGGGLARACRAGRLITLIISDVLGDPLDVIASGPTVPNTTTPEDALAVLEQFGAREAGIEAAVFDYLRRQHDAGRATRQQPTCRVANYVIGNNAVAVDAAGGEAERRGYSHAMHAARQLEGDAEGVGRHLARMAREMQSKAGPNCLITGGEPTVTLVDEAHRGLGGRNQQLALAALIDLQASATNDARAPASGIVILSGGTDGEDGPTDAAGALIDEAVAAAAEQHGLDPRDFLQRNDAYHFFAQTGGLLKTGPTHTNVCDVRVTLVARPSET